MSKHSNTTFLHHLENAIEALEDLQPHPLHTDWVKRSDYEREIRIPLGTSVDCLLNDLYKKRDAVRKVVMQEERESMEQWICVSAQGTAPHPHPESTDAAPPL